MTAHVIVAGGGLGGFAAAALLARAGHQVTLFEASGAPGGRARSSVKEGYVLNLGPHALAMGGPGTRVFEDLGIPLPGRPAAAHRLRLLIGDRLVSPLRRRAGGPGIRGLAASVSLARDAASGEPTGTVSDWLGRVTADDRTRRFLEAVARLGTYADALDVQAADMLAEALRGGTVRYLDGGWQQLVEGLRGRAVDLGVDVVTGAAVRHVDIVSGTVEGVETDQGTVRADAVVLAVGGPDAVARLLDGHAEEVTRGWAAHAVPARLATLDVALGKRPTGPTLVLGIDEPLYLSVHSDRARLAPGNGAVVHVARFLGVAEQPDPAAVRRQLEGLLERCLPGWRRHRIHERFLPSITVAHDLALAGRRVRPTPQVPGTDGLFVVGDWVGDRGTLAQASLASARAVVDGLAGHQVRLRAGTAGRMDPA